MLPTDLAYERISAARLKTPLSTEPPENDPETEEFVLDEIAKLVEQAQNDVIVLVDACAVRHGVREEAEHFYKHTGYPVYCAPMGKSVVDETYERYGGVRVFSGGSYSCGDSRSRNDRRSTSAQYLVTSSRRRSRTQSSSSRSVA